MKFINDLNLKKQARDLGVKIWQTPAFLFIIMGLFTIIIMTATYFISLNYNSPEILIVSECIVVSIIMIIGTSIIRMVNEVISLNKMKSEFVSVASHQLRTPLSAIRWETELLLTKFKKGLDKNQLNNIHDIDDLSKRMTKLVNDLLDVARIEQNRLILRKRNFNFAEITQETVREMISVKRLRHVGLSLDIEKNLPKTVSDPEKIKMVMENLIGNAFKYTTSGGKIDIKLFKKEDDIIFEVKDNGVGIPKEQLNRVFDKFFRSDNAVKYQTEGTGLGLYIAKNVIKQLGGHMWFQSIENVGSVFSFSLPCERILRKIEKNPQIILNNFKKPSRTVKKICLKKFL